jgi:hypothetical protein
MVALTGQVYAANFRAEDLLVADDPLFVRKHRFVPVELSVRDPYATGKLDISSNAAGSRIEGGFNGIAAAAGQAAAGSLRDLDMATSFVASALLGSVRATDWSHIDQRSIRAFAVRIHAAQDWLILAATQPSVYEAVRDSTCGLLSFNRRARLLAAVRLRDWDTVWKSASLSDLYFLADRLRTRAGNEDQSPSINEYIAAAPVPMIWPTSETYELAATSHPAGLAQRLAEFNLYLVRLFAEQSLPASDLPAVAEAASRAVLTDIQMTGIGDWQSVLDAYEAFDSARLRQLVGQL